MEAKEVERSEGSAKDTRIMMITYMEEVLVGLRAGEINEVALVYRKSDGQMQAAMRPQQASVDPYRWASAMVLAAEPCCKLEDCELNQLRQSVLGKLEALTGSAEMNMRVKRAKKR